MGKEIGIPRKFRKSNPSIRYWLRTQKNLMSQELLKEWFQENFNLKKAYKTWLATYFIGKITVIWIPWPKAYQNLFMTFLIEEERDGALFFACWLPNFMGIINKKFMTLLLFAKSSIMEHLLLMIFKIQVQSEETNNASIWFMELTSVWMQETSCISPH